MRNPVQKLILNFVKKNPDCEMREIVNGLREVGRSSISSSLPVLVRQGLLMRKVGRNDTYEYRISASEPLKANEIKVEAAPVPAPVKKPLVPVRQQNVISPAEWQNQFKKIREMKAKGFHRRAERMSLELLDVTAEPELREKLITFKAGTNRVGIWL